MQKKREQIAEYYAEPMRQHKLKIFTFIMFLVLALEKVLAGATAALYDNDGIFILPCEFRMLYA